MSSELGGLSACLGGDDFDFKCGSNSCFFGGQIVDGLEIKPEPWVLSEISAKPQSSFRSHCTFAVENVSDAP